MSPAPGETDVDTESLLVITFDRPVALIGGQMKLTYNAGTLVVVRAVTLSNSNTTIAENTVTIDPGSLPSQKLVKVVIDAGTFRDVANNVSQFINPTGGWSFTTMALPDFAAPQLIATVPAADSHLEEPVNSLEMKFNEPIRLGTGQLVVLREKTGAVLLQIDLTSSNTNVNATTLTVPLQVSLPPNEQLYVRVSFGAVEDLSGNKFTGIADKRWKFSTQTIITGIEHAPFASDLQYTAEGNYIRISPTRGNITIDAISDALGRMITFERAGNDVVFRNPGSLFMVIGTFDKERATWKAVVTNP
jgi:methionine-rich copper-binding protein CopC